MYFPNLSPAFGAFVDTLPGKTVAVIGHARPDGDCIGSQVALARVLGARGIEAVCVNEDPIPRRLAFVSGDETFRAPDEWLCGDLVRICVDCADPDRPGKRIGALGAAFDGNVDHHVSNTHYARYNFVDSGSAATAEILGGVFFDLGFEVDAVAAQGLFVGIATDTGQFRFPSTSRRVFEICGRLVELGADPAMASNYLYEQETMGKLRLLEAYLSSLRRECDGRVCIGALPRDVFERTGAGVEDTEGLVDYARSINGVDVGVILEDRGAEVKGSLRAKEPRFRVNDLAARFNGGGHACAAGFTATEAMDAFYPRFLEALRKHFTDVDAAPAAERSL